MLTPSGGNNNPACLPHASVERGGWMIKFEDKMMGKEG
jgi:hypothetical protein